MTVLLIILVVLFLAVGGVGFVAHAVWWGLILVGVLFLVALFARGRGGPGGGVP